jgi:hypothetical protein
MRESLKQARHTLTLSGILLGTVLVSPNQATATVLQIAPDNLQRIHLETAGWRTLSSKFKYLPWSGCEAGKYCGKDLVAPFKRSYRGNFTKLADYQGYYWGECVSLVKALSKNTARTHEWRPGTSLVKAIKEGNIEVGTAIATFPRGRYRGHAAFYAGADISPEGNIEGVWLYDQNWIPNKVLFHKIDGSGSGAGNFKNYSVIRVPQGSQISPSIPQTPQQRRVDRTPRRFNDGLDTISDTVR